MQYLRFRSLWGVDDPLSAVMPRIKALGYIGVESPLPEANRSAEFKSLLAENGLEYIALIFSGGANVREHLKTFQNEIERAKIFNPIVINTHSGRDSWNETERREFFAGALKIESDSGARISHETHRGRILYNPWVTRDVLREFPALNLCCDFSHWVCVAERLLEDAEEEIALAAAHCLHVHARVGYEEGPQVPDPRAAEYERHLEAHERWWQMIWSAQAQRGFKSTTITAEYGPPDYMHTLPHSRLPAADLWEVCEWQAQRQAEKFEEWRAYRGNLK